MAHLQKACVGKFFPKRCVSAFAIPERNYRYLLRGMPAGSYRLRAGEDLDKDGVSCEAFEACGWRGGLTEGEAVAVPFVPGVDALRGLGIDIALPPP